MDVCVIGAGYVGLVTSCSLVHLGHKVVVVEADKHKLEMLRSGECPFYEPGVSELLKSHADGELLSFADNIAEGVKSSEIIFICVGTPPLPSGEPDMSAVVAVARSIGAALDSGRKRIIVNKSTVPVGSGNWVEMLVNQGMQAVQTVPARSAKPDSLSFSVVSNPEFLREGSALHDTFYPDRVVIGSSDAGAINRMRELYRPLIEQTFSPPETAARPAGFAAVPFVVTDLASAEMIKYSANAFLAMKISFANEMAGICERVGADVKEVARGIGLDKRIGTAFLNAGVGWGGSCFGKDVHALIEVAREYSAPTPLLEATISVNKNQRHVAIKKLQEELKIIKGRVIALMGLSFKPDTDDLRDAASLTIASQLIKMGASLRAYDPVSIASCKRLHPELEIDYCHNVQELADGADALVLVTEWAEFQNLDWHRIASSMKNRIIVDGRNVLNKEELKAAGFVYRGIGM
ncbi:MAG: UDP-glucose/GDP-mannose dehydrogenase family protein [Candidatus Obscuribacterales bacterium]|nr:UDP-glucose/GDP-mannose dehydrogenase family protein [Candidatus Obscuribacterales bacterium]